MGKFTIGIITIIDAMNKLQNFIEDERLEAVELSLSYYKGNTSIVLTDIETVGGVVADVIFDSRTTVLNAKNDKELYLELKGLLIQVLDGLSVGGNSDLISDTDNSVNTLKH